MVRVSVTVGVMVGVTDGMGVGVRTASPGARVALGETARAVKLLVGWDEGKIVGK